MTKYNPEKHHRRSIRLKGYDYTQPGSYFITICTWQRHCLFGEITHGQMQLNRYGRIVQKHWQNLIRHHQYMELGEFVIMPNHIHGILILKGVSEERKSLDIESTLIKLEKSPKKHGIPEIIRGFKTFSARQINTVRDTLGVPVWQRNYYEHIIRNQQAYDKIYQYIKDNPVLWEVDQLHPECPSKW